jgi:hypothetical protein
MKKIAYYANLLKGKLQILSRELLSLRKLLRPFNKLLSSVGGLLRALLRATKYNAMAS